LCVNIAPYYGPSGFNIEWLLSVLCQQMKFDFIAQSRTHNNLWSVLRNIPLHSATVCPAANVAKKKISDYQKYSEWPGSAGSGCTPNGSDTLSLFFSE